MNRRAGVATIEVITTADRQVVQGTRFAEGGVLLSVSVMAIVGTPEVGQLWVEAGIMRGGVGDAYKVAILVQQYVALTRGAWWTGGIPLSANDNLYLEARGDEAYTVRMTAMIEGEREGVA